jgi:predicted nucleic acid-binding protein
VRFVDTNVLLYAVSSAAAEAEKSERAVAILNASDLALSVQVLQEFYVQATRTTAVTPLRHDTAVAFIRTMQRFPVQDLTVPIMHASFTAAVRWRLSYWDAAIVEAARALECEEVLTEDLQHGQDFGGVRVVNPFGS